MFKNNNFIDNNKPTKTFKYFIAAFALFILILSIVSVVMFMKSIDFNIDNLTGKTTTETTENVENFNTVDTELADLTGKSRILFVCENNNALDFVCVIETDFDKGYMTVESFDDSDMIAKDKTLAQIYTEKSVDGVKTVILQDYNISIDKYVVCNRKQLKDILSLFDEIEVDVEKAVDYHSYEFVLELDVGKQVLSEDFLVKYLIVSDDKTRSQIFCDIINSVLVPKYTQNSQKLFTSFVNNCKTNISVIDYSEKIDDLIVYSNSSDKFLATVK